MKTRLFIVSVLALLVIGGVSWLWAATPEAVHRAGGDVLPFTSSSADYEAGDVIAIDDGRRAAIVVADIDYSLNPVGNVYVSGLFDVTCSSSVYFQSGDPVYWDASGNTAIRAPAEDSDFFLGLCERDHTSGTTVRVALNVAPSIAPALGDVVFDDDFIGYQLMLSETGSAGRWLSVDVGDATEAVQADAHGGVADLVIAATDEAEDAVLYFGDQLNFDIDSLKRVEIRAAITTPGTGVRIVWGMAGNHNLDKDSVAQNAWFSCDGSLACKCETDDGTNDNDDKTAQTLTTGTYYEFVIDFTDTSDVKFYIDGQQMASSTTFDMSNYTGNLQPYFSCDKASGTSTGTLSIDYVRVISSR